MRTPRRRIAACVLATAIVAVSCSDSDEGFIFTSAHLVVDGQLGEVCLGARDPLLVGAWNDLAAITPRGDSPILPCSPASNPTATPKPTPSPS